MFLAQFTLTAGGGLGNRDVKKVAMKVKATCRAPGAGGVGGSAGAGFVPSVCEDSEESPLFSAWKYRAMDSKYLLIN